jgi:hypothetical protein
MQFVEAYEDSDVNGNTFIEYRMLEAGENWLLDWSFALFRPDVIPPGRLGSATGNDRQALLSLTILVQFRGSAFFALDAA